MSIIYLDNILKYCLIGVGVLVVAFIVAFIYAKVIKNKTKKQGNELCAKIILNLGDKENIKSLEAKGSRLVVTLLDESKINEEELKNIGVTSILKMSSKVTLVIGNISSDVVNYYNN